MQVDGCDDCVVGEAGEEIDEARRELAREDLLDRLGAVAFERLVARRASASATVRRRMASLISGIAAASIERSRRPRPTSRQAASGSDAIAPQSETGRLYFLPTSVTVLMSRRIAGLNGEARAASDWLARSIASAYWTRSFVPRLKNSASRAKTSAMTAAAGTSIIMPSGMCSSNERPRARTCSIACVEEPPHLAHLVHARDHGDHDADVAVGARAHHRAELREEDLGLPQREADGAQAERRVHLRRASGTCSRTCRRRCRTCAA